MNKLRALFGAALFVVCFPQLIWGAPCCGGDSPKSFFSLQELQTFDFSLVSSFRDFYGWYTPEGQAVEKKGPTDLSLQASSVVRLSPNWEGFLRLPLMLRTTEDGTGQESRFNLGDMSLGTRLTILRSLFVEDPFPTISVVVAAKLPSGSIESKESSFIRPGTGNGLWEPMAGLSFRKDYYGLLANIDFTFTQLLGQVSGRSVREKQIFLTESVGYSVFRELNVTLGSNQMWSFDRGTVGESVVNSQGRSIGAFASANYFMTQFASLGAQVDWTLPVDGFGVNQPIARGASLSFRYGFY